MIRNEFLRNKKFTCSVPQPKINSASIHYHICTEIVKYCWHIILFPNTKQKKIETIFNLTISYLQSYQKHQNCMK